MKKFNNHQKKILLFSLIVFVSSFLSAGEINYVFSDDDVVYGYDGQKTLTPIREGRYPTLAGEDHLVSQGRQGYCYSTLSNDDCLETASRNTHQYFISPNGKKVIYFPHRRPIVAVDAFPPFPRPQPNQILPSSLNLSEMFPVGGLNQLAWGPESDVILGHDWNNVFLFDFERKKTEKIEAPQDLEYFHFTSGTTMALSKNRENLLVDYLLEMSHFRIAVYNFDKKEWRDVLEPGYIIRDPQWSRDGKRILFGGSKSEDYEHGRYISAYCVYSLDLKNPTPKKEACATQ